jgi:hypothetical protein
MRLGRVDQISGVGTVTSSLTFTLVSSVTPQTFTETLTGDASGIAGAFTHLTQVSVTVVATGGFRR